MSRSTARSKWRAVISATAAVAALAFSAGAASAASAAVIHPAASQSVAAPAAVQQVAAPDASQYVARAVHPATPPPPLTQRYIISNDGNGNCMDVDEYPGIGDEVGFENCGDVSGGWQDIWVFQVISNGDYMIHPDWSNLQCLTLSTTQLGVSRDESCVGSSGAANQQFSDINEGDSVYEIFNYDLDVFLNDPHTGSGAQHIAGTIDTCYPGLAGCNMGQA